MGGLPVVQDAAGGSGRSREGAPSAESCLCAGRSGWSRAVILWILIFQSLSGPPRRIPPRATCARGGPLREGPFVAPQDVRRLLHVHRFGNLDGTASLEQRTALRLGGGLIVVLRLNQTVAAGGIGTNVLGH